MPTNRRRYTRGRRSELAELRPEMRFTLESGGGLSEVEEDTLRESWEMHGEWLLEEWEAKHPGTRPWGWWEFEAPEPRRVLNPPPPGSHLDGASAKRGGRVWVGDGGSPVELVPWLEEEADYLARLGLD